MKVLKIVIGWSAVIAFLAMWAFQRDMVVMAFHLALDWWWHIIIAVIATTVAVPWALREWKQMRMSPEERERREDFDDMLNMMRSDFIQPEHVDVLERQYCKKWGAHHKGIGLRLASINPKLHCNYLAMKDAAERRKHDLKPVEDRIDALNAKDSRQQ